jgi:NMD protein affecting ribosome stability and mRNA decay
MNDMKKLCVACGVEIPLARLKALPETKVCVNCSAVKPKRAVTIVGGEGEDTYNDIIIMNEKEYQEYVKDDLRKNTLD